MSTDNAIEKARRVFPVLAYYASVLRKTLTYGDLAQITGDHHRSFRYAFDVIHNWVEESAGKYGFIKLPLAIIVVQKGGSLPGPGAIRWRLKENGLPESSNPGIIQSLFKHEQDNIFEFPYWDKVIADHKLLPYLPKLRDIAEITKELAKRRHTGAESAAHKQLKEAIGKHPELIGLPKSAKLIGFEVTLHSLDRADLVLEHDGVLYPIEVKSHEVDEPEFTRGVYQAIKYQALFSARQKDAGRSGIVQARLACGRVATPEEQLRCLLLDVPLFHNLRSA